MRHKQINYTRLVRHNLREARRELLHAKRSKNIARILKAKQRLQNIGFTRFFMPLLPESRSNAMKLMAAMASGPRADVTGRYIVMPVRCGRNTGIRDGCF